MSSPYTIQTGPGYQGINTVTSDRCLVSVSSLVAGDWPVGASVSLQDHELGVTAIRGEVHSPLGLIEVLNDGDGNYLRLTAAVLDTITDSRPSDVRVYDLAEYDDREGLLLVDADDDPTLERGDSE